MMKRDGAVLVTLDASMVRMVSPRLTTDRRRLAGKRPVGRRPKLIYQVVYCTVRWNKALAN